MLHLAIREGLEQHFAIRLVQPPALHQDALLFDLDNGVSIELRFANRNEYVIAWHWGEAELRIDTAPLHRELASYPNHLHDADGEVRADPLTHPGGDPWANVAAVLQAVLADPLLKAI